MEIKNEFNIGDTVYSKTDIEQRARIVTGISIRMGSISYAASLDGNEVWFYGIELSDRKNVLMCI